MASKKETFTTPNYDITKVNAAVYETMQQLDWQPLEYVNSKFFAVSKKRTGGNYEEILIEADSNQITIESKLGNDGILDLRKRNKKTIDAFKAKYTNIVDSMDEATVAWHNRTLVDMQQKTMVQAENEMAEFAEVDKKMNLSVSNLYATYSIVAINVIVFILMAIDGAGIFDANGLVHIKWGSNYKTLTVGGQWWRLFTAVFLHFGVVHLFMNMYALLQVGVYLEPMLGKMRYIVAYISAGVLASVTSLAMHADAVNSAGASGAVFGMYGLIIALLITKTIPAQIRQSLLSGIVILVVYNFAYGASSSGIDNWAHGGGFVSGFFIGMLYSYVLKQEWLKNVKPNTPILVTIIAATFAISIIYLSKQTVTEKDRHEMKLLLADAKSKDYKKLDLVLGQVFSLQEKGMAIFKDSGITRDNELQYLKEKSLPAWKEADSLLATTDNMRIADERKTYINSFKLYIELRLKECNTMIELSEKPDRYEELVLKLNDSRKQLDSITQQMNKNAK